jgi:hypothetical protein
MPLYTYIHNLLNVLVQIANKMRLNKSKLYAHNNNCKSNLWGKEDKGKEKAAAQIGTNVRARVFNAGLLARSQFASARSYDRPTRWRFSEVFLCPRANAELVHKFHLALHASHAALPMVTLKMSPCTNVTSTFDFGLDLPVHGGYGRGSPTPTRRSNCQTKKLKSAYGPRWGPSTKTNWPTDRR